MTDPVAIVSGAASGIGRAIAAHLGSRSWQIASLDLQTTPDCAASHVVDMTDPAAVADAVADITDRLGPPSAAISAAGYYEMLPISEISTTSWQRMLRVHLGGLVNLTHAVLPQMRARRSGSIVAITSELAIGGGGDDSHYAAAKGAVIGLVRSLAVEAAAYDVRVNAVAPGPTDTPLLAADSPWRAPDYLATLPTGRLARPDEVALCVAALVEEGSFLVGEVLSPNSGAVI